MNAIHRLLPEDRQHWLALRAQDVTSTEVSALFGLNPYLSAYELWHRKAEQDLGEIAETERMTWGTRLQDAIGKGVAADQGWKVRRMAQYLRDPSARLGASFDFEIIAHPDGPGLLEIKTVDRMVYQSYWQDGDLPEAPPHIEIQVQQQMLVSGRRWAMIAALVGGNEIKLIRRDFDAEIDAELRRRTLAFWASIADRQPPDPNYFLDARFIAAQFRQSTPGSVLDARANSRLMTLAERYQNLSQDIRRMESEKAAIKAEVLTTIGPAEKVLLADASISAKTVPAKDITYTRAAYRDFRIHKGQSHES